MKVKVKLDKDALLGGLIAHGEKIAFGVFMLMFLLLCFGALKQSPYDKTPEKFISEATRVDQLVNSASLPRDIEARKLPPVVIIEPKEISKEVYAINKPINEPPGQSGSERRGEPKFLTVQDLQVGAEYGAVTVKPVADPAAGAARPLPGGAAPPPVAVSEIQGKQWAVITGVIPTPQQLKEYRSTFSNSPQPKLDVPRWRRFEVQRQEGDGAWTPLNLQMVEGGRTMQVVTVPEPPEFKNLMLLSQLCQPAPSLIGKSHDHAIIHPKIAELAPEHGGAAGLKPLANPVMNANQPGQMGPPGAAKIQENLPEFAVDQMFRCFDYTVQPGKSYRYKVRLLLENPNYDLPRYLVREAEMIKSSTRPSDWSEPSPVVNVPPASSILAGPVERPRSLSQEATCQSVLRMWDPARAVDALKFSRLWRGQMANYTVDTPLLKPSTGKVETETVNFQTNLVLIDMAGGESLPTYRGRSPGRMLLLSPTGELDVKSELTDVSTFDSELDRIAELAKAANPEPEPKAPASKPEEEDGKKRRDGDRERSREDRKKRDQ
jgi:hypothetical protein